MKKIIIHILLVLAFVITYLFHVNLFSWFKIAGVMPNVFIILVLFIGLFLGRIQGTTYGIIFGILLDFFIGRRVGITAIMLGVIGLIGGIFDKNFSKESRIAIILMVIASTLIYEIGSYTIGFFIYNYMFNFVTFIKILLIECFYNLLITIILYPIMQNLGHIIEDEFKRNKILTRYF